MKPLIGKYDSLIPLLLVCLFFTWKAIHFPAHDFANYYFGGKFLANGHFTSSVYFPYDFNKTIADLGFRNIFASYAPNTPFLALLFVPFSFLPLVVAKLTLNLLSILLFVYSLKRLVSFYKIEPVFLLLVPILFFVPIKNELLFGQVYFLLFFLIAESWLAYEKNQWVKMGIFLGVAVFLKVFPILLILVFVFKRQFRPIKYVLASCVILLLFSILFSGIDIWIFYFKNVLPKASSGEISEAFVTNYQSVFMFLKQLLVYDSVLNPDVIRNAPQTFQALIIAFKIMLFSIGFYISRKANNSLFVISYWILAMVLLSPYGSTYTFVLLLLPYFSLMKSALSSVKKILGCLFIFAVANLPLQAFISNAFPFSYLRLFALLLLFSLFLSWLYYTIEIKIVMISVAAGFAVAYFFPINKSENSSYLLGRDMPILIYDYRISKDLLTYYYWNETGKNSAFIPLENALTKVGEVKENQIFLDDKQLTFDTSYKEKPLLINNNTMLYLSDFDRGIGFYTLRKIDIR